MRRQIAQFLPEAILTAMKSYQNFCAVTDESEDAKGFSAHHSACKAAIAHIELLTKLAKWADLPDQNGHKEEDQALADILKDAEKELKKLQS